MLGWGIVLTYLGILACRLALRDRRPLAWYTLVVLGVLALSTVAGVMMGPMDHNRTPDQVRAVAAPPVLAVEPEAQHTFRIYLSWNHTRTNPFFVPLAAVAVGTGLALVRSVVGRTSLFLTVAMTVTVLSSSSATARWCTRAYTRTSP